MGNEEIELATESTESPSPAPETCQHCHQDIVAHHYRNLKCPVGETIYRRDEGPMLSAPESCAYCDSQSLAVCAECFKKPQDRAAKRSKECEQLVAERELLFIATCSAVSLLNSVIHKQEESQQAHDILRQVLTDYADLRENSISTRTQTIRNQQRSGSGEVTAIMVSGGSEP